MSGPLLSASPAVPIARDKPWEVPLLSPWPGGGPSLCTSSVSSFGLPTYPLTSRVVLGRLFSDSRSKNGSLDERRRTDTIRKRSLVALKGRIPLLLQGFFIGTRNKVDHSDIERIGIHRIVNQENWSLPQTSSCQ
jgi:hypothetical protein